MQDEIEATFTGVDHEALRVALKGLGAGLVQSEYVTRRTNFDHKDLRLDAKAAWIRLRDEGERVTLTFKHRQSETIDGMKEIEIVVDDYEKTKELLLAAGLIVKSEQETRRELWKLGDVEVMLDTWPWIDPIIEIEGPSEEGVKTLSEKLGLSWKDAIFDSADALYQRVFDVTRTEISTCPILFGPIPDWLEARRRQAS